MLHKLLDRIDGWRTNVCVCLAFSVALSMLWLVVTPRWVLGCAAAPSISSVIASPPAFATPSKATASPAPARINELVGSTKHAPIAAVTSAQGLAVAWRSMLHRNAIDFIRHALSSDAMLAELDASTGRHRIFELFRSTLECDLNDFIRYVCLSTFRISKFRVH
jgi:hypothetical protein